MRGIKSYKGWAAKGTARRISEENCILTGVPLVCSSVVIGGTGL
jgi:hypothetical protein